MRDGTDKEQPLASKPAVDTAFMPGAGSQILTFETKDGGGAVTGRFALLQGHDDGTGAFLAVYDLEAPIGARRRAAHRFE